MCASAWTFRKLSLNFLQTPSTSLRTTAFCCSISAVFCSTKSAIAFSAASRRSLACSSAIETRWRNAGCDGVNGGGWKSALSCGRYVGCSGVDDGSSVVLPLTFSGVITGVGGGGGTTRLRNDEYVDVDSA